MQDTCNTKKDMKKMQEDAIKRAHEMQSRAQKFDSDEQKVHFKKPQYLKFKYGTKAKSKVETSAFESLFEDSERNLIMLLILLLLEENSNSDIIMALMYLVM